MDYMQYLGKCVMLTSKRRLQQWKRAEDFFSFHKFCLNLRSCCVSLTVFNACLWQCQTFFMHVRTQFSFFSGYIIIRMGYYYSNLIISNNYFRYLELFLKYALPTLVLLLTNHSEFMTSYTYSMREHAYPLTPGIQTLFYTALLILRLQVCSDGAKQIKF